jgi:hypothetical protein
MGFAFDANYQIEYPSDGGVATGGNGTTWTYDISNATSLPVTVLTWVAWTPPYGLAESGMPWRIAYSSGVAESRTIYRNTTGNVGLRIEHDGAIATWIRDSIVVTVQPFSSVTLEGVVVNCQPEDLNGSGGIDQADIAELVGQWGGSGSGDLDKNGAVGPEDLALLLAAYGS